MPVRALVTFVVLTSALALNYPAWAQQLTQENDFAVSAPTQDVDGKVLDFPRDNPAVTILTDDAKEIGSASALSEPSRLSPWDKLFDHGSPFHYGLAVGETYDTNIFITQKKVGDFYTHISPLLEFEKGDKTAVGGNYLDIVFKPTIFLYQRRSDQDRTDYDVDALYQHRWSRLVLSVEQRFQELTDPSIDVGNFFKEDVYTTRVAADYEYNDKLSFGGSETQVISDISNQQITQTSEWISDVYARYRVTPKLSAAFGPRIGVVDIVGAPNQTYEQALARVAYQMTEKITINFEGGAEAREYQRGPTRIYPVFAGNATWTPTDGTTVKVSAIRQNLVSYGELDQNYLSTQLEGSVRQRMFGDFFFTVNGGYFIADYEPAGGDVTTPGRRRDRYFFAGAGVEWDPREWMSVGLRAQTSSDDSTFETNSFNESSIDLQSAVKF